MRDSRAFRLAVTLLACLLTPIASFSQGFAGLGSSADGFAIPQRGTVLEFPRDHGAHPDFRIEWWYVTANLQTTTGQRLGAQWTLFRSALAPGEKQGWSDPQIWIGHAAVTTVNEHYVAERLARGGIGQAGVKVQPFEATIDDWWMKSTGDSQDQIGRLALSANGESFSYQLNLEAQRPLILQGDRGYSVKSLAGQASYYYSQPFYTVSGSVTLNGFPVNVSGQAWLDREWSSQPLNADQTGWDWFSLHLATGEKLMAFRLRDGGDGYISGNWISPDGSTTALAPDDVVLEPLRSAEVQGRSVPVEWSVKVQSRGLDIRTKPLNEQSWMSTSTPYWEGPIQFEGSVSGEGYLEMTGY